MDGVSTLDTGGFDTVVWESVLDTVAGGVTLDPTGLSAAFPSGIIPAGTLVGRKNGTTGLSHIVTITPGTPDTYDYVPLGMTREKALVKNNTLVAVVTKGTARIASVPAAVATGWDDLVKVLPGINFV